MADRTVAVNLIGRAQSLAAAFASAGKGAKDFKGELDDLGTKSPKKMNDIALATGVAGAALLGLAAYAVHAAMAFDKQMSEVSAVSNATGKDLTGLRTAALQAGKDTQYSATQAAQAEAELAKAGISTADIMGGALSGSLSLAAAGQMNLADAATIAAQTMNIFELRGKDVGHIADVLASAANTSAADMQGLGLGLQQVGLVAHQAGFSLEETVGVLAAFADRGLQGSDGATSLKTAIQRLTAPTDVARATMDSLGISVYDTNGNVKSAADLAGILQTKLGGLSVEQRNTAMQTIFGSDAIRAANVLYSLGADGVRKYTAAVDQNGAAADTARKKTDNLAGDIERLKGSVETLAIEAGSGANGGLRTLVQALDAVVSGFSALPGPVQTSITVLAGVGGTGLLAVAGLLKAKQTVDEFMVALRGMGPAGERAATGLSRIASAVGKGAGIAAGLFILYEGFTALGKWIDTWNAPVVRDVDKMTVSLKEFSATGRSTGEMARAFGPELGRLAKDINDVAKSNEYLARTNVEARRIGASGGKGGGSFAETQADITRKSVLQQREDLKALDQAFAGLATSGGVNQAKIALEQLSAATGKPVSELLALMPRYQEAMAAAAASTGGAAKGFGDAATNAHTLAGGLEDAVHAGQSLKDVFDQLNGAQINLTQAQINAHAAVDELNAALKESKGSMDLNTEAGRKAAQTSVDLATKGRDVAQSTYEQTGSIEQARGAFEVYRQKLIESISTAGGTRRATDETRAAAGRLADQIMQMPALKQIDVNLRDNATDKILSIQSHLNSLQNRTVTVTTKQNVITGAVTKSVNAGPAFNRWGGLYEHAQEGVLREANVYSPRSPARYAYAEPGTGGEAFIPKYGNRQRSMGILNKAASWLGTSVGGGTRQVTYMIYDATDPNRVVAAIKEYEKQNTANWRSG